MNLHKILVLDDKPRCRRVLRASLAASGYQVVEAAALARPASDAQVVMQADAGDEFHILDCNPEWVHVQLSGPARGWIRSSQTDRSGVSVPSSPGVSESSASHSPRPQTASLPKTHQGTATFPGDCEPLRGKKVQIIWV
jgi:SH3 domain-containing protein